jgi:integrase
LAAPSRKAQTGKAIALPAMIVDIPTLALKHRYAARNVLIAELALFHAFSASQIAALNVDDVDLGRRLVRRRGSEHWMPLVTRNLGAWDEIAESTATNADAPLCRTRSGARVSRVDVWRVLHRLGIEAQLPMRLNTRRSRKWVGNALGRRNEISADSLQRTMGVRDPRAIAKYLPTKSVSDLPNHVVGRPARLEDQPH